MQPSPRSTRSPLLVQVLVATTVFALLVAIVAAVGWFRAASERPTSSDLDRETRQALLEEVLAESPGVHRQAHFEPRIGYTLVPNRTITAWNDTFETNALGYRTGPVEKREGTFRIVFVGDSWTFGMGVRESESFPRVLEELANVHAGSERRIEAWPLALPGYNLENGLSALEFFRERLAPNAVVVVPSGNDNHSTSAVLPNGSLSGQGGAEDGFGDPHLVFYQLRHVDSFRFRDRWRQAMARLRTAERRLREQGVPVVLFFLARWSALEVHGRIQEAGLESRYAVMPEELTVGRWENPRPPGHGTSEANRLHARVVYRLLAGELGWLPLPPDPELDRWVGDVPVFDSPPGGEDWSMRLDELFSRESERIPHRYAPSRTTRRLVAGPHDPESGLMARATTVLVRPRPGDARVGIAVRRLPDAPSLYPLELRVTIPIEQGGTTTSTRLPRDGPELHRFDVPIPARARPGAVLDVVLVAERTVASPDVRWGRSLFIEEVVTLP